MQRFRSEYFVLQCAIYKSKNKNIQTCNFTCSLYGCETWSRVLREGHKLRVLLLLPPKTAEGTEEWKKNQIRYCYYYDHKIGKWSSTLGRDHKDDDKTELKSASHSIITAKITRRSKFYDGILSSQCSLTNRVVTSVCANFRTPV